MSFVDGKKKKQPDELITRTFSHLRKGYRLLERRHVPSQSIIFAGGIFVGILAGVLFVADQTGKIGFSQAAVVYQASADFVTYPWQSGGLSDSNRWSYLEGVTGIPLVYYASDPDCGGQPCWKGSEQYVLIGKDWAHPGGNASVMRRWTASQSGLVHINNTGLFPAQDANGGCGDGVNISIRKNGTGDLWSQYIANGNTAGFSFDLPTMSVVAGDYIDFIVDKAIQDNWCDATYFDAKIEFTPGAPSTVNTTGVAHQYTPEFSRSQGPIWFYRDSMGGDLTYQEATQQWKGNEEFLLLWPGGGHPGGNADAVLVFKSPASGIVHVKGVVKAIGAAGGDGGIVASIKKESAFLWSQAVRRETVDGNAFYISGLSVNAGDEIQFIINKGPENNWYDTTSFDPVVEYESFAFTDAERTFYQQPALSVQNNILMQPTTIPDNKTVVIFWGQGTSVAAKSISWAVGKYTGFYPPSPASSYQRGVNNVKAGTTAVQLSGTTVGIVNNPPSVSEAASLVPIILQQSFPVSQGPRPWGHAASELQLAMDLQVPAGYAAKGAVGYVQASLAVHDASKSTKPFWVQVSAYDTRGSFSEVIQGDDCEGCTGLAVVGSAFKSGTQYVRMGSGSHVSTGVPWSGFKQFKFAMSRNELLRAVAAVKNKFPLAYGNVSDRPEDYEILLVGVLNEIYYPSGSDARVGASIRNLKGVERY